MTVKKMVIIALGYDNELPPQDVNTIQNTKKKLDTNTKYEWHFFYYIPNIPAVCLLEREFNLIEQTYRDKAKVALQHLSQTLGIPLPLQGGLINYNKMIEFGSTAIIQAVKNSGEESIIITSQPDKLKFDLFDRTMHWIKGTALWQQMSDKFLKSSPRNQVTLMTPKQFAEKNQTKQLNIDKTSHENSSQAIANSHPFTKLWQEPNRKASPFPIKGSIKTCSPRGSNEEETDKEEALSNLSCKLPF